MAGGQLGCRWEQLRRGDQRLKEARGNQPCRAQLKREDQSPGAAGGEIGLVVGRSEARTGQGGWIRQVRSKEIRNPASSQRCSGGSGQLMVVRPDRVSGLPVLSASAECYHASVHRGCIPPRLHCVPSMVAGAPTLPNPHDAKCSTDDNAAALPRDAIWVSGCLQQGGTTAITLYFSRDFPRAAKMMQSLLRPRLHHCKTLPPTCRCHPPKAVFG